MNIAVIFAGGSGVRMGAGIPKQFLEINGKPIIVHTLELFENHNDIDKIYIVMLKDYIPYMNKLVKKFAISKVCGIVEGGAAVDFFFRIYVPYGLTVYDCSHFAYAFHSAEGVMQSAYGRSR